MLLHPLHPILYIYLVGSTLYYIYLVGSTLYYIYLVGSTLYYIYLVGSRPGCVGCCVNILLVWQIILLSIYYWYDI